MRPHGLQHARLLCPPLCPGVCSNSRPSSQYCYFTISSSVVPFSCPQSFPASGSFPVSRLFQSGGQSIGASASVLPMNTQHWFPLRLGLHDQKQAMTIVLFFLISIEPSSPAWQLTSGKPCFPDLQSELFDASLASQQAEVEHHTLGLIKIALTTLRGTLEVGEAVFFIFPARLRNYDQLFNPSPGGSRTTASFLRPRGQREPQRKKGTLPSKQVSYGNKQIWTY